MIRLSVNITDETAAALRTLAERKGLSVTDVVRRAVLVFKYIEDESERGMIFRICDPDAETSDPIRDDNERPA